MVDGWNFTIVSLLEDVEAYLDGLLLDRMSVSESFIFSAPEFYDLQKSPQPWVFPNDLLEIESQIL